LTQKNTWHSFYSLLIFKRMKHKLFEIFIIGFFAQLTLSGCVFLHESAKNGFNDGIYHTRRVGGREVYVLNIDDDTTAVFDVKEFKDSTAILTNKRVNYATTQKKFKDNKASHTFYRPSYDLDLMTIAMKYRPTELGVPNQLTTSFNGAVYFGYRIDAYSIKYKRNPLNIYKKAVKHVGYSAGLYAGLGNTVINGTSLNDVNYPLEYDGVLLITGIAANMAMDKITFGLSFGPDYLMDKYHTEWIYEGKPTVGFTLGLNLK